MRPPENWNDSKSKDEIFADRDELKRLINESPEAFWERDESGKGLTCPICDSGSGKNKKNKHQKGDGMTIKRMSSGNIRISCWSCGFKGDVFDLLKQSRGLEFNEALKYGAEILGRQDLLDKEGKPSSSYRNPEKKMQPPAIKPVEEEETDYTDFFKECFHFLWRKGYDEEAIAESVGRGLSPETLKNFWVGMIKKWRHPKIDKEIKNLETAIKVEADEKVKKEMIERVEWLKKIPYTPRLIIPTSKYSYLARDTRANLTESQKKYAKQKAGKVHLFNEKALRNGGIFFAVEGEIDAMSIVEVGGQAVGLGSKSNGSYLIEALEKLENKPAVIVVAFDNEEEAKKEALKLESDLNNLGIRAIVKNEIFSPYKDANDYLMADRQGFKRVIEQEIKAATTVSEKPCERSNENQEKKSESSTSHVEGEISEGKSMNDKLVDRDVQEGVAGKYDDVEGKLKKRCTNLAEYLRNGEFQNVIDESIANCKIKTGFSNMQQPLYPGLYGLGGIPALGKTSLSLQTSCQIAEAGHKVIFISYEQSESFLTAKIFARESYILSNRDKKKSLTATGIIRGDSGEAKKAVEAKYKAAGALSENINLLEAGPDDDVDNLIKTIESEFLSKGEKPVVFIDYLQRIPPKKGSGRQTTKEIVDYAIFRLNQFQRKHKLVIFVISSFNRDNYGTPASQESFKESGGIEYTADVLIAMQLEAISNPISTLANANNVFERRLALGKEMRKKPREIELVYLKNRFGDLHSGIKFKYYPEYDFFEPMESAESAEVDEQSEEEERAPSKFDKRKKNKGKQQSQEKEYQPPQPPPPPPDDDYNFDDEMFEDGKD